MIILIQKKCLRGKFEGNIIEIEQDEVWWSMGVWVIKVKKAPWWSVAKQSNLFITSTLLHWVVIETVTDVLVTPVTREA